MNWYATSGSGGQRPAGARGSDGDAMCGIASMFDAVAGKILVVGGSPSYDNVEATANAQVITLAEPGSTASVATLPAARSRRAFANSVVLPDGTVFITGGQSFALPFSNNTATLTPELFNPRTNTFTPLLANAIPRTFHSVAPLLPDGTIFSGGGGLYGGCSTNHF